MDEREHPGNFDNAYTALPTDDGGLLVAMQALFPKSTTPTDAETPAMQQDRQKTQKVIIDGQLYIRRGEQLFNALGQML